VFLAVPILRFYDRRKGMMWFLSKNVAILCGKENPTSDGGAGCLECLHWVVGLLDDYGSTTVCVCLLVGLGGPLLVVLGLGERGFTACPALFSPLSTP
jgi:hypothetical protein